MDGMGIVDKEWKTDDDDDDEHEHEHEYELNLASDF